MALRQLFQQIEIAQRCALVGGPGELGRKKKNAQGEIKYRRVAARVACSKK
jgi:hypothetical protein